MPVYEYVCRKCGTTTEALRRMADSDQPQACDRCGSHETTRSHSVFHAVGDSGRDRSLPVGGAPGMCGQCGGAPGSCAMG
jgi:putative FmdB family regulatory protein